MQTPQYRVRVTRIAIIFAILTQLIACSNTNVQKKPKKSDTYHVSKDAEISAEERAQYAALLDELEGEKSTTAKTEESPMVVVKLSPKATVHKYNGGAKKPSVQQPQRRMKTQHNAITNQWRKPAQTIRYASLTGDYANNAEALRFIDAMVAKHGYDRGYLNYLFSNTQATPFLQKMAYNDAYPIKRKRNSKPRPGRWNRYRGNFLTPKTINKGVQFWRQNRVALQRAEQQYGVPQEYILGIIGVETRYGGNIGKNRAIDALAAMGFNNPRRGKYFRSELEAFLLMTQREGLDPLKPMASYAGALGLSQFMPSNIKRFAVDHDRNGSVNLWTPPDAIGSVANYFKKHGWQQGGTVAVPASSSNTNYRALKAGFKSRHSLATLKNNGVTAANYGNISGEASLIKLNTYDGDELWVGGHNFYVITRYNHSSRYAMAVHQLAQAIKKRVGGSNLRLAGL